MQPRETSCPRCEGCGQIANDEDGTPWTFWEELPEASAIAARLGLIRPVACPDCKGTGRHETKGGEV